MVMFLLSFVKGSKSAEGLKNPPADTDLDRGGPILGESKSARTPAVLISFSYACKI